MPAPPPRPGVQWLTTTLLQVPATLDSALPVQRGAGRRVLWVSAQEPSPGSPGNRGDPASGSQSRFPHFLQRGGRGQDCPSQPAPPIHPCHHVDVPAPPQLGSSPTLQLVQGEPGPGRSGRVRSGAQSLLILIPQWLLAGRALLWPHSGLSKADESSFSPGPGQSPRLLARYPPSLLGSPA